MLGFGVTVAAGGAAGGGGSRWRGRGRWRAGGGGTQLREGCFVVRRAREGGREGRSARRRRRCQFRRSNGFSNCRGRRNRLRFIRRRCHGGRLFRFLLLKVRRPDGIAHGG